jgi:uncharacterized protein
MRRVLGTAAIWLILMLSVSGGIAHSDPLEDAASALQRGDYATALRLARPLAEQGNAQAQASVASMYFKGQGIAPDYQEAAKWYRLGAEQGNAVAQTALGSMYFRGQGVAHDYIEAAKWYRLGAEQGNAAAQTALGSMYYMGQGVPKDHLRAYMWYSLAGSRLSGGVGKEATGIRNIIQKTLGPAQLSSAEEMVQRCEANNLKGCD